MLASELKVTQWITSGLDNIMLNIHPESEEYINDHGGSHGDEGDIDKILPDGSGGNAQDFSDAGTNPKNLPLNKILDPSHGVKLALFFK
jgi:hypothetical protein